MPAGTVCRKRISPKSKLTHDSSECNESRKLQVSSYESRPRVSSPARLTIHDSQAGSAEFGLPNSAVLFRRDEEGQSFGVTDDRQGATYTHLRIGQQTVQIVDAGDGFLVERYDYVAFAQTGRPRRAIWLDADNHYAAFLWADCRSARCGDGWERSGQRRQCSCAECAHRATAGWRRILPY